MGPHNFLRRIFHTSTKISAPRLVSETFSTHFRYKCLRGFSVLEMLIAMTVLLMAFSATMMLLPGVQNTSVDTEMAVEALGLVEKMLEQQQSLARKDFKLVVATSSEETIGNLTYQKAITAVSTDYFTKEVTATVSWDGMYNRAQTITLKTVVSNFEETTGGDTCDSIITGNWSLPFVVNAGVGSKSLLGADMVGDASGLYPISDIDVYRKRAYVSVAGSSQTTAATNPGTGTNSTTIGTLAWSTPGNIVSSNNSYATRVTNGTTATNYLRASNFGFTIPKGATILGITAEIERSRTTGGGTSVEVRDNEVKLVKADGTVGTINKATATPWPTSDAYATYGSQSDLWGEKWTASDINDNDFGVVLSARGVSNTGTNRTAQVDHVRITVTYIRQMYVLNLSTPTTPTTIGELTANPGILPAGAGFNSIVVATSTSYGSYAFAATNSTVAHLQSIDVGGTNPTILNSYAIPNAGSAVANTIFFKDGYVYLGLANNTAGGEFIIIDVHNPAVIPSPLATFEVGAGVNAIYVKDGYAFLATNDPLRELVVLNLNDLAHPILRGIYNAPPSGASTFGLGRSVYTVGDTLYFGRYYISSDPELAILNTATANPTLLGSKDIGTSLDARSVYGTLVRGALSFLFTGNATGATSKVQIFNNTNPANITTVTSLDLVTAGEPRGFDCESNYVYAASVPTSGGNTNKGSIHIITAP